MFCWFTLQEQTIFIKFFDYLNIENLILERERERDCK